MPASRVEMPLPRPEDKIFLDPATITAKKINGLWQIWAGPKPIRFVGDDEAGAKDIVSMMRELHPTEWISIGSPRPIIEYGLTNGKPAISAGFPRAVVPIDLRTVKVEAVRGVWCLKDAGNILFNFGLNRADADQALAVIHRYGFNRIGMLGSDVTAPALTYFFVALDADGAKPVPANPFLVTVQENGLARTGIPVPGLGYFGEMIKVDARKVEVRRDGIDWVVAFGNEVLARFGQDQNGARDAQRFIHDSGFTEFCHTGAAGVSFFLVNGQLPTRVPLYVQSRRLDSGGLRASQLGTRWAVTDRGRHLFDVANQAEGEAVILLMKHFQFDQLCQIGSSPRTNLTFLAKGR
jgi:hypothetical protein